MTFEWNRMHKWEDNILNSIDEAVFEYVLEHYAVDEIAELSPEQIQELRDFIEENEYSILSSGFYNIFNTWESEYEE